MALRSTDLAILSARFGVARFGASRFGFYPYDVEGSGADEPGEYVWKEDKPPTTLWTLQSLFSFCGQVPTAAFTDTPDPSIVDTEVQFTDQSTPTEHVSFWYWDFGDGNYSYEQNPTHIYTAAGTYTVTLYISGVRGSASASGTHTVQLLTANITGNVTCDGNPVTSWPVYLEMDGVPWAAGPATTDGSGDYTFENVPAGEAYVYITGTTCSESKTNSGTHTPPTATVLDIEAFGV